jgi:hypothetical protein
MLAVRCRLRVDPIGIKEWHSRADPIAAKSP